MARDAQRLFLERYLMSFFDETKSRVIPATSYFVTGINNFYFNL